VDETSVRNQFLVRIVNKRNAPAKFAVKLGETPGSLRQVGFDSTVEVAPLGEVVQPLVLVQPRANYSGKFHFNVSVGDVAGRYAIVRRVEFVGPEARLLREEEKEKREKR
jgi:hypothetical protein